MTDDWLTSSERRTFQNEKASCVSSGASYRGARGCIAGLDGGDVGPWIETAATRYDALEETQLAFSF